MKKRLFLFATLALAGIMILASGQVRVGKSLRDLTTLADLDLAASDWSTPINISKTNFDSRTPVIAVDGNGKAYVTWVEWYGGVGERRDMMFSTNASGQWSAASGPSLNYTAIDDVGFPTVAVTKSGNAVYQAWHDGDFSIGRMGIFFRQAVGGAWSQPVNMAGAAIACSYPALAMSPVDNTLYLAYMADPTDTVVFELAIRYKDGVTGQWSSPEMIPGQTGGSKYTYAVHKFCIDAKGTAHLVYTTHSEAWYTKNPTPKNIGTWTTGLNISGGTGLSDTIPRIAVDDDGEAYIVWTNVAGIFFKKTVNGAWQGTENISLTSSNVCDFPTIAVNPITKDIYAAWQQNLGGSSSVIRMSTFEKSKGSWTAPVNMTSTSGLSGEPFLTIERTGTLHLVYSDRVGAQSEIMYTAKLGAAANSLTLTSPNGGENWLAGTVHNITWTTAGTVANVKIEYSTDGGTTGTTIVQSVANTGTYAWTVPGTLSTNCLVGISSAADATISDRSDAPFTISPPPKPYAPLNIALDTSLDGTGTKKVNTVTWQVNPANGGLVLKNYRIYRKLSTQADSSFAFLAAASGTALQYADANLEVLQKYAYRVTALTVNDDESDPSATVVETKKFEFPPVNLAVQTGFNRIVFFQVKINTLTFAKNTLNDDSTVSGYKVYRRKAEQGTDQYALIATLNSSTFTFKDGTTSGDRLVANQKYAYAVVTTYSDGRVSAMAEVVTQQ